MKNIISITLIALFYACNSLGQTNLRIEIQGGKSYNAFGQGTMSNWGDGWAIGGGAGCRIMPNTDVTLNLLYSHYPYTGNSLFLAFPDIAGLRYSVSGQPSNTYETSIGMRFSSQAHFINPFISLRMGLYILNAGDITISEWFDSNLQKVSYSKYYDSGISSTDIFLGIGIGFIIPVNSKIGLGLEGRFSQLLNSKGSFLPVIANINYNL